MKEMGRQRDGWRACPLAEGRTDRQIVTIRDRTLLYKTLQNYDEMKEKRRERCRRMVKEEKSVED